MTETTIKTPNNSLGNAKWLLILGIAVIVFAPFLLTSHYFHKRFNFSETGQIGDTIGGITAPFLNLIGAFLVFYALKAQVTANTIIQAQISNDNDSKESENETQNLNQLYAYLNESINSFHFTTLPIEELKNVDQIDTDVEYSGGQAFYHLFSQIRCHYHGTQDELHQHQAVSELLSILKIMDLLLLKLQSSKGKNNVILFTLVRHLFNYKIITRIREEPADQLHQKFCSSCQCNHGLPDELRNLITEIREKLS